VAGSRCTIAGAIGERRHSVGMALQQRPDVRVAVLAPSPGPLVVPHPRGEGHPVSVGRKTPVYGMIWEPTRAIQRRAAQRGTLRGEFWEDSGRDGRESTAVHPALVGPHPSRVPPSLRPGLLRGGGATAESTGNDDRLPEATRASARGARKKTWLLRTNGCGYLDIPILSCAESARLG
jgi:hypothetical protein